MENQNQTQEPTFRMLKITSYKGVVNYVPLNRDNKEYYHRKKTALTGEKREKQKIEEVTLSLDEAVELGISEAHQIKFPMRKKKDPNADLIAALSEQNKLLMQMLADKQETKTKSK